MTAISYTAASPLNVALAAGYVKMSALAQLAFEAHEMRSKEIRPDVELNPALERG